MAGPILHGAPEGLIFSRRISDSFSFILSEVTTPGGRSHNPTGPSYEKTYASTGTVARRDFRIDGSLHREDGPAFEEFGLSGNLERHEYYVHGVRHNALGPAVLWWDENEQVIKCKFYLNGEKMTEEDFLARTPATKSAEKR
jgi:hypothetical protein